MRTARQAGTRVAVRHDGVLAASAPHRMGLRARTRVGERARVVRSLRASNGHAPNVLDELKRHTTVVADTGDFELMAQYAPRDATTNPSLILKAVKQPQYAHILEETVRDAAASGVTDVDEIIDRVLVRFGCEILQIIPGRVSTEIDARLSFDTESSYTRAKRIIEMYKAAGFDKERVLIKLATTWEGVLAAKLLEAEGIHCNMTLLFSLVQAVACAEVDATLISPFVGRILDWYKKATGNEYSAEEDPGVLSVKAIYNYYKKFGHKTEVMGASFRNIGEILEIAGVDLITVSPALLGELKSLVGTISPKLTPEAAQATEMQRISFPSLGHKRVPFTDSFVFPDEKRFRFMMNEDGMATEKLSEGIRLFAKDTKELELMIREELSKLGAAAHK